MPLFTDDCDSGYQYDNNSKTCVACERGYYRDKTTQPQSYVCQNCADGFTTVSTGSQSCVVGRYSSSSNLPTVAVLFRWLLVLLSFAVVCPAGQKAVGSGSDYECQECGYDEYQPDEGELMCIACDKGKYTQQQGSTGERDCIDPPTCQSDSCAEKEYCTVKDGNPPELECLCFSAYKRENDVCRREFSDVNVNSSTIWRSVTSPALSHFRHL